MTSEFSAELLTAEAVFALPADLPFAKDPPNRTGRPLCTRPARAMPETLQGVLRRLASVSPSASVELTHAATILQRPLTLSERRCTCLTLAGSTQWLRVAGLSSAAAPLLPSHKIPTWLSSCRGTQEMGSHNGQGHVSLANEASFDGLSTARRTMGAMGVRNVIDAMSAMNAIGVRNVKSVMSVMYMTKTMSVMSHRGPRITTIR